MSLLHRNLLSAAFVDMLKKFEPIVKDTLETAVSIVSPAAAPLVDAGIEVADAAVRANNPDIPAAAPGSVTSANVAGAVAAVASAPPASSPSSSAPAPSSPSTPQAAAALAAIEALALQLSQIATQVEAIKANVQAPSAT